MTLGIPSTRMLKLQAKESCKGVARNSFCMSLSGSVPALEVDGQLQAGQVRLVAHVGDLPDLAGLDQFGHFVHDGLGGGGVGDLVDLDADFRP